MLTVLMWCFLVPITAQVPMNDTLEFQRTPLIWHVTEGVNVTLECEARGNPTPAINWDTNNDTLSTTENQTTLLIIGVSQSKNYTCTATNIHGRIFQTFHVNVTSTTTTNNTTTTTATTAIITTAASMNQPTELCPLELIPKKVVERYGASFSVICRPTTTSADLDIIGWETSVGKWNLIMPDNTSATWYVEKLKDWTLKPSCYGTFISDLCQVTLPITLYKTPDTVSVSVQGHSGPLREGRNYTLRCDVFDVAPVAALTVSWLWRGKIFGTQTYKKNTTKTPVDVSSTLEVTALRNDEVITCLTTLDLKQVGPSEQVNASYQVIVNYAPEFTDEYDSVEVVTGGNVSFGCSAVGNPPPKVKWNYTVAINAKETAWGRQNTVIILTRATSANGGIYNCVATNEVDTVNRSITLTVTPPGHTPGVNVVLIVVTVILVILIMILLAYSFFLKKQGAYRLTDRNPEILLSEL